MASLFVPAGIFACWFQHSRRVALTPTPLPTREGLKAFSPLPAVRGVGGVGKWVKWRRITVRFGHVAFIQTPVDKTSTSHISPPSMPYWRQLIFMARILQMQFGVNHERRQENTASRELG
jgi:hypothetical protein